MSKIYSDIEELTHGFPEHNVSFLDHQKGIQDIQVCLPEIDGLSFVRVGDILYCEGAGAQSKIFIQGKQLLINRTLKELDKTLCPLDFCRIHKSYIVNLRCITRYYKGKGGYVVLTNAKKLQVSASYKEIFLSRLVKL